jgi:hypothetical protein
MNADQIIMTTELTPEDVLVGKEAITGRILCAIPAVRGARYAIAPVPRSQRKARAVMVPRGVPWAASPLGIVLVLHHEDTASRAVTGSRMNPSAQDIELAHPGLRAELLARLGQWGAVEQLLVQQPCATQWVRAAQDAQLFPLPDSGAGEHRALVLLRELVEVLPVRRAAQRAVGEVLASLGLDRP